MAIDFDRLGVLRQELLDRLVVDDLADPAKTLQKKPGVARRVDEVIRLLMDVSAQVFIDIPGFESRRDVLNMLINDILLEEHGPQSLTVFVSARWADTLALIELYEDKSADKHDRLRAKPKLIARGLIK